MPKLQKIEKIRLHPIEVSKGHRQPTQRHPENKVQRKRKSIKKKKKKKKNTHTLQHSRHNIYTFISF
jgi:hypothetical protein